VVPPSLSVRDDLGGQRLQQPERLDCGQPSGVEHREVRRRHQVPGQHHRLRAGVGAQPNRRARQPCDQVLLTAEADPVAQPQHWPRLGHHALTAPRMHFLQR
jgi:hypothetical protein